MSVNVNVNVNTGWLGENWTSMAASTDEHLNRSKPQFLYHKIKKLIWVICIYDPDDKLTNQVTLEELGWRTMAQPCGWLWFVFLLSFSNYNVYLYRILLYHHNSSQLTLSYLMKSKESFTGEYIFHAPTFRGRSQPYVHICSGFSSNENHVYLIWSPLRIIYLLL